MNELGVYVRATLRRGLWQKALILLQHSAVPQRADPKADRGACDEAADVLWPLVPEFIAASWTAGIQAAGLARLASLRTSTAPFTVDVPRKHADRILTALAKVTTDPPRLGIGPPQLKVFGIAAGMHAQLARLVAPAATPRGIALAAPIVFYKAPWQEAATLAARCVEHVPRSSSSSEDANDAASSVVGPPRPRLSPDVFAHMLPALATRRRQDTHASLVPAAATLAFRADDADRRAGGPPWLAAVMRDDAARAAAVRAAPRQHAWRVALAFVHGKRSQDTTATPLAAHAMSRRLHGEHWALGLAVLAKTQLPQHPLVLEARAELLCVSWANVLATLQLSPATTARYFELVSSIVEPHATPPGLAVAITRLAVTHGLWQQALCYARDLDAETLPRRALRAAAFLAGPAQFYALYATHQELLQRLEHDVTAWRTTASAAAAEQRARGSSSASAVAPPPSRDGWWDDVAELLRVGFVACDAVAALPRATAGWARAVEVLQLADAAGVSMGLQATDGVAPRDFLRRLHHRMQRVVSPGPKTKSHLTPAAATTTPATTTTEARSEGHGRSTQHREPPAAGASHAHRAAAQQAQPSGRHAQPQRLRMNDLAQQVCERVAADVARAKAAADRHRRSGHQQQRRTPPPPPSALHATAWEYALDLARGGRIAGGSAFTIIDEALHTCPAVVHPPVAVVAELRRRLCPAAPKHPLMDVTGRERVSWGVALVVVAAAHASGHRPGDLALAHAVRSFAVDGASRDHGGPRRHSSMWASAADVFVRSASPLLSSMPFLRAGLGLLSTVAQTVPHDADAIRSVVWCRALELFATRADLAADARAAMLVVTTCGRSGQWVAAVQVARLANAQHSGSKPEAAAPARDAPSSPRAAPTTAGGHSSNNRIADAALLGALLSAVRGRKHRDDDTIAATTSGWRVIVTALSAAARQSLDRSAVELVGEAFVRLAAANQDVARWLVDDAGLLREDSEPVLAIRKMFEQRLLSYDRGVHGPPAVLLRLVAPCVSPHALVAVAAACGQAKYGSARWAAWVMVGAIPAARRPAVAAAAPDLFAGRDVAAAKDATPPPGGSAVRDT